MIELFKLTDNFLEKYKTADVKWGYGELSKFVYRRSYSRIKDNGDNEEWWETCARVIQTEFGIQENYCKRVGLPWNAHKAQNTAQKSYDRMFNFKWLPPGRGIWAMDHTLLNKLNSSAPLQNCAYRSTLDIKKGFGEVFSWATDALMNGIGVGFSTEGAGTIKIEKPIEPSEVFQIPDTRQGWAEAVRLLLNSYRGNNKVEFDFSLIRKAGAIIKTFGGQASGPGVLKQGIQDIRTILDDLIGKDITSTAIVDIFNLIAKFVVAGGTRRSALLSVGEVFDTEFLELKDPIKYSKELQSHRWSSNNSVMVRNNESLDHLTPNILANGEPGLLFYDNLRHYGRMKDGFYPDGHPKCENKIVGVNPCCRFDSLVATKEYGLKKIGELAKLENGFTILNGNKKWAKARAWGNGVKKIYRVSINDGRHIDLTEDHVIETVESSKAYNKIKVTEETKVKDLLGKNVYPFLGDGNWDGEFIDPDDCLFYGLIQGDGSWHHYQNGIPANIKFNNKEPEVIEFLNNYCSKNSITIYYQSDGVINIPTKGISEKLLNFGFDFRILPERKLPTKVIGLNPISAKSFLRGLFSANGASQGKYNRISLKSTCLDMVKEVQFLMLALGFNSYITTNKPSKIKWHNGTFTSKQSYDLNIGTSWGFDKFQKEIGFLHVHKNSQISKRNGKFGSVKGSKVIKVELLGEEEVFDFTESETHWGWVNGIKTHNCAEQLLESGELCTLVELFPANHESLEDYLETVKVAYLYGKTVTLLPTHWPETNQVMIRNRRIGLSQSGIQQALKKFGPSTYFKDYCDKAYKFVEELDQIYSRWLGIPNSMRMTTVKPSGSVSLLAGATPGVHCAHSEYYMRTVRVSSNDPLVEKMISAGYKIEIANTSKKEFEANSPNWKENLDVSKDITSKEWEDFKIEGGTVVVYFPIHESNFTKSKTDITLWEQLTLAKEMQYHWSDNSVSITATVKENERNDLGWVIEFFRSHLKTVSFLPLTEHSYSQAPYQECSKEEFEEYSNNIKPLGEIKTNSSQESDKFCSNDRCTI